ncbi:MAG: hypothetical protein R3E39_10070 [Anaerolineae bacterium]
MTKAEFLLMDSDLLKLLQIPLFLNILMLSYHDGLLNDVKQRAPTARQQFLYDTYIRNRPANMSENLPTYSED